MASGAKPTGCYKCGQPGHWSRDCPSRPPSQTAPAGPETTAASAHLAAGAGQAQGGAERWQASPQGVKRKEAGGSGAVVAKEKAKTGVQSRRVPKLTPDVLLGADGLGYVLEKIPRQVSIKGRGHEVEDLRSLLGAYVRWHENVLPYYSYSQFVEKVEKVGSSKRVRLCVRELRQKVERGEKLGSADTSVAVESEEASAEARNGRQESFSEAEEGGSTPAADVIGDHPREATAAAEVPAAAAAAAGSSRGVVVIGQGAQSWGVPEMREEQRARMEANKQKALERARARKVELEKARSGAPS